MNNFEIEPERILFDIILNFVLDNRNKKTRKLLRSVKFKLNKDLNLEKRFPVTLTADRFTLIDSDEIFVQNQNQLDTNNISVLDMMRVGGSVWSFDKTEHKKHFFELLKKLFDHGARSIYHIESGKQIPYLIFMTLNSKHLLEIFLRYADKQETKYEPFFRFIFNDAYKHQDTVVTPKDNGQLILGNFLLKKGYTVLHTLIECMYNNYYDTMDRIIESKNIKLYFDFNKNNPFYLALEMYNGGNENLTLTSNDELIIPYFYILGMENIDLRVNRYNHFDNENLTTFMMLLRAYHFEPDPRIKDELFENIRTINEVFSPNFKTRREGINPLLYFLSILSVGEYQSDLHYFTSYLKDEYRDDNMLYNIRFKGTVEMFKLLTKGKQYRNMTQISNQYLSPLLYILSLNLDHNRNVDYNKLIDILRNSFTRFEKADITQSFIKLFQTNDLDSNWGVTENIDGINIYHDQIIKNLLQFELLDFEGSEIRIINIINNNIDKEQNIKNIKFVENLLIKGIPLKKILSDDEFILMLDNLFVNEYRSLFSTIIETNKDVGNKLKIKHPKLEKMPLISYMEWLINKIMEKLNYHHYDDFEKERQDQELIQMLNFYKPYTISSYNTIFQNYLYYYHAQYKKIKDTLIKYFENKNFEDPELIAINFMTENDVKPEYIEDGNDENYKTYFQDGDPDYPYNVISQYRHYTNLWYPNEITLTDQRSIFNLLKQLVEEDKNKDDKMIQMKDYYLTGGEMVKRFKDLN